MHYLSFVSNNGDLFFRLLHYKNEQLWPIPLTQDGRESEKKNDPQLNAYRR